MSVTYVNPEDERIEVRGNCGGTAESNLAEADIDKALSAADEETTERTGLLPGDARMVQMRRKMKVLLASAYLMIRFSNLIDVRANILKEIDGMTEQMKVLEDTGVGDDESIIEGTDVPEYRDEGIWVGGTRFSRGGRGTSGLADEYILTRLGVF